MELLGGADEVGSLRSRLSAIQTSPYPDFYAHCHHLSPA